MSIVDLYSYKDFPRTSLQRNNIILKTIIVNPILSFSILFFYNNYILKVIVVLSQNRVSGHAPSQFRFKLKDAIQGQYSLAFTIISKTDPIFSTFNNKLVISIGAISSTIL